MGEKEDKEKAEKLAAAKKRVAQLQKKKKAAATATAGGAAATGEAKGKAKGKKGKKEENADVEAEEQHEDAKEDDQEQEGSGDEAEQPEVQTKDEFDTEEANPDETTFNDAIKAANEQEPADSSTVSSRKHMARQPSVSQQSKARSTSFRQGADPNAPLSPSLGPDGAADESLYRKQALRIEELEKDNKRLSKEASDGEVRWRKSEEELEELRERTAEQEAQTFDNEVETLRQEIALLRRQPKASTSSAATSSKSVPGDGDGSEGLRKDLASKEATISDLQVEISRLRGRLSAQDEGSESHSEQVVALQTNLERAETSVRKLEAELADSKKALSRASEKAVLEGTEKTSKETKIKNLERENEELRSIKQELDKKVETLEKKVDAMNKLHREAEQRNASKLTTAEAQAREAAKLEARLSALTDENQRLKETARKKAIVGGIGGVDDDHLDELEDEARRKLETRIRELEGEVFELRRGVWRDRRKSLQAGGNAGTADGNAEDEDDFDDVDLSGSGALSRRRSTASQQYQQKQQQHSGFTQVLNSGLAAFRSSAISPDNTSRQTTMTRARNDSLLQDFDDDADMPFDEAAFAQAQREEELKKMVEHVREVKRGLKNWIGWRLDLVDSRRRSSAATSSTGSVGVGGGINGGNVEVGEIFDL